MHLLCPTRVSCGMFLLITVIYNQLDDCFHIVVRNDNFSHENVPTAIVFQIGSGLC